MYVYVRPSVHASVRACYILQVLYSDIAVSAGPTAAAHLLEWTLEDLGGNHAWGVGFVPGISFVRICMAID